MLEKIILITIISGVILSILGIVKLAPATYPTKRSIEKFYETTFLDINKYSFYYKKATSYRKLFSFHLTYHYATKILAAIATLTTAYLAIKNNDFTKLCAIIASICDVISLTIPFDKLSSTYVKCARIMENALNADNIGKDESEIMKSLDTAYQECEGIIAREYI